MSGSAEQHSTQHSEPSVYLDTFISTDTQVTILYTSKRKHSFGRLLLSTGGDGEVLLNVLRC